MAQTIHLDDSLHAALRVVAVNRDCSILDIVRAACSATVLSEMQSDQVVALAVARKLGLSWDQLETLQTLDNLAAGQLLSSAL